MIASGTSSKSSSLLSLESSGYVSVRYSHLSLCLSEGFSLQGLYGAFVVKFNLQVSAFRRNHLAAYPVSEAVTLATLTAAFSYFNKFLRIDMTESLAILFRECEGGGDYDNLCQCVPFIYRLDPLLIRA